MLFGTLYEASAFGMTLDVPELSSVNIPSLTLTAGAVIAVFRFKVGMLTVLAACSVLGVLYGTIFGLA